MTGHYEAASHRGKSVVLNTARALGAGQAVNLTDAIKADAGFFA
ncbi:MAG TPA: hypothetical protein VLZ89_12595 [Anaerolineales bacterium]|nr:hypothetical protein [Anaerolineales bacterium]